MRLFRSRRRRRDRLPVDARVGPGLCGKLPTEADYIRLGAQPPGVEDFDRWLHASLERASPRFMTQALGARHVHFIHALPRHVLIGVFRMSCDRVGRRFPLAMVHAHSDLRDVYPATPLACSAFFLRARLALNELVDMAPVDVAELLSSVECPSDERWLAATTRLDADAERIPANRLRARWFTEDPFGLEYALTMIQRATALARRRPDASFGLQFPVNDAWDCARWLAVVHRLLGPRGPAPHVLWVTGFGSMVVGFGAPHEALLEGLLKPGSAPDVLWSLRPTDRACATRCVQVLPSRARALCEREGTSVGQLVAVLADA